MFFENSTHLRREKYEFDLGTARLRQINPRIHFRSDEINRRF